jgi:hypothetical protein
VVGRASVSGERKALDFRDRGRGSAAICARAGISAAVPSTIWQRGAVPR